MTAWTARRWVREYARAYHDCSMWLASWCLPWAWVHGFWQAARDLRLLISGSPGQLVPDEGDVRVMTAIRYAVVALAVVGAGVALGLLIVVVRDAAAGRWRL